jgi:hypothetical protein
MKKSIPILISVVVLSIIAVAQISNPLYYLTNTFYI